MTKSKWLVYLIIILVGVFLLCIVYTTLDNCIQKETITTTIIDKWFDPSFSYKVELEDHRIFSVSSFDYFHLQLNKPYKLKVYKLAVVITDERWRI